MNKKHLLETFLRLLEKKGGKIKKNKVRFYTRELNLVDSEGIKYEISGIDKTDPDNLIFDLERYDEDGRKFVIQKTTEEIIKDYKEA